MRFVARVNGCDAEGERLPSDVDEAGVLHRSRKLLLHWKMRDGLGQVRVQPRLREEWILRRDDSRLLARVLLSEGRVESVEAIRP